LANLSVFELFVAEKIMYSQLHLANDNIQNIPQP